MTKVRDYLALASFAALIFGLLFLREMAFSNLSATVEWAHQLSESIFGS